jgi:16S rRNA pseudouridine516 synthase
MELFKFLQQQGFGSRKVCRQLVASGLVYIDGRLIDDPSCAVDPAAVSSMTINGVVWHPLRWPVYVLLHKPADYEVSRSPAHHRSVFGLLPDPLRNLELSAVGRLDADTTGLLLFSTNGAFVHALTSPRHHVPKRYRVALKHEAGPEFAARLVDGVLLHDDPEPVRAVQAVLTGPKTLLLTITEGRYHQVKRMIAAAGNRVEALHREALGELELGDLPVGNWRELSRDELDLLGF